ncbi:MAG: hypothetical protein OHK93_008688 [Ramalina farinacea]|uniref:Uncharacterized protein n=1 Tax=Ramalina farinacea TaxID=258253 RepID=A0AA43QS68_9LECA|nr:hypothetical protein [Ramalina farinacea]
MTAATATPHFTSGTVGMFGGTKDGKEAYIDFKNNTANINKPEEVPVKVQDMRTMNPPPTFAKNGYEFRSHVTSVTPEQLARGKDSPEAGKIVDEDYMSEVVKIIQSATGGAEVIPNGFRLRTQFQDGKDIVKSKVAYGSVNVVHVDRDPENAHMRLKTSIGKERAEPLLKKYKGKKWASVNVWRPIGDTVGKWPLLFVNHEQVPEWDYDTHMVHVHTIDDPAVLERGDKGHETVLRNDPRYAYHYVSNVTIDEVLVFASFHVDPKMVVPHGAFWDDSSPEDAPTRRSIEARCWVFWDEDA